MPDSQSLEKASTAADEQPLSFTDVKIAHQYAQQRDPFFAGMTLQAFSRHMNEQLGTNKYAAGDVSGLSRLASEYNSAITEGPSPISEWSGEQGARLGAL